MNFDPKTAVLSDITHGVERAVRALAKVENTARQAREDIAKGHRPQTGMSSSSIFSRYANDADAAWGHVTALIEVARYLDVSDDEFMAAYAEGAKEGAKR